MSCDDVDAPKNMKINCSSFYFNSICEFECETGYKLLGSSSISCQLQPNGQSVDWSAKPPSCQRQYHFNISKFQ